MPRVLQLRVADRILSEAQKDALDYGGTINKYNPLVDKAELDATVGADVTAAAAAAAAAQADATTAIADAAAAQADATTGIADAAAAQADATTAIADAAAAQADATTAIADAAAAQADATTGIADAATAQGTANTALANAATAQSAVEAIDTASEYPYTPGNGLHWTDPDPTTLQAALDRMASALNTLIGGSIP